jgi:hypothetical protein
LHPSSSLFFFLFVFFISFEILLFDLRDFSRLDINHKYVEMMFFWISFSRRGDQTWLI